MTAGYRQACVAVLHSEAKVSDVGLGIPFGGIRGCTAVGPRAGW